MSVAGGKMKTLFDFLQSPEREIREKVYDGSWGKIYVKLPREEVEVIRASLIEFPDGLKIYAIITEDKKDLNITVERVKQPVVNILLSAYKDEAYVGRGLLAVRNDLVRQLAKWGKKYRFPHWEAMWIIAERANDLRKALGRDKMFVKVL
ncbi:hypothetical protein [Pyrococcus kukulkanii]|uniref:Uncharacterized protein n=1 Tax=Pyrococcus kukulkanii TaxID=1609559 RepID=A0ABV4T5Q2_9EURY